MAKVFLSYRRADSVQVTGRIYDKLVAHYGEGNIFKDVDSIPLGVDFQKALEDSVARCDVMLVVIGRNWSTATDEDGRHRLEDPSDFVRSEVESALASDVRIIPLLIESAKMPSQYELPESLRSLAFRNAAMIRPDPDFHRDVERVIRSIGDPTDRVAASPGGERQAANLHPAIESSYQIRITCGPVAGRVFALNRPQITIGRSGHCDIHLEGEPYCSRTHFVLEWDRSKGVFVLNAWHLLGAVLNDIRVEGRVMLAAGDRIAIGTTEMILERA